MGHTLAEAKSGKYVYVAGVAGGPLNTLLAFKVGATGALTQAAFAETQSLSVDTPSRCHPTASSSTSRDPNGLDLPLHRECDDRRAHRGRGDLDAVRV